VYVCVSVCMHMRAQENVYAVFVWVFDSVGLYACGCVGVRGCVFVCVYMHACECAGVYASCI